MPGLDIRDLVLYRRAEWLDVLASLVEHESPSRDKPSLDSLARMLADRFEAIGGEVAVIANPEGGDHVRSRFFGDISDRKPALVLGHYDTVWPLGTLASMPFRVEDNRAFGPGVFDMKASLVEAEFAIDGLRLGHLGHPPRPVEVLITSDEEIGSPTSRLLIEDLARRAEYVLVLEPPLPDGSLKTGRKGVGHFVVEIEGKAAHAGVEPRRGLSAIEELARLILYFHSLTDHEAGTSVNVGVVEGGTTSNVIAARATARVDVRATSIEQAGRVEQAIRRAKPSKPGFKLTIRGGFNRPPMVRTQGVADLFERARSLGRTIGLELGEGSTGGGSDGNFTAALGVPTLDGLGIRGSGAHAVHEQVELDSVPERTALLAALLMHL